MFLKLFLLINGLIGVAFGIAYFLDPSAQDNTPEIVANATAGIEGLRHIFATVVHIALGGILLYSLVNAAFIRPALWCLIIATGGMGVLRLVMTIMASDYTATNIGVVIFELVIAGIGYLLLPGERAAA